MKNKKQLLEDAIENQSIGCIKSLLSQGVNVNSRLDDWKKLTPLHIACAGGNVDVIKVLIENGARINSTARSKYTPLAIAISNGDIEATRYLLSCGADISIRPSYTTHLINAVISKNIELVELVLDLEKSVNLLDYDKRPPLFYSIPISKEISDLLIKNGADVNICCNHGSYPIHWCSGWKGYGYFLDNIIDAGADIMQKDYDGKTAFHWAVLFGNWSNIVRLFSKGVDIDEKDKHLISPISEAVSHNNIKIVDLLVSLGVKKYGSFVFNICAMNNNLDMAKRLIFHGFEINEYSKFGENAAFYLRTIEMAELLIENGLNINIVSKSNDTPETVARLFGKKELAKFLNERSNKETNEETRIYLEKREKRINEIIERAKHENPIA